MKSTEHDATIDISALHTEDGISKAAVGMALVTMEAILYPVLDNMPPARRGELLERYLSAIAGAMCGQVGPEATCKILDEVKLALVSVQAQRERKH